MSAPDEQTEQINNLGPIGLDESPIPEPKNEELVIDIDESGLVANINGSAGNSSNGGNRFFNALEKVFASIVSIFD